MLHTTPAEGNTMKITKYYYILYLMGPSDSPFRSGLSPSAPEKNIWLLNYEMFLDFLREFLVSCLVPSWQHTGVKTLFDYVPHMKQDECTVYTTHKPQ